MDAWIRRSTRRPSRWRRLLARLGLYRQAPIGGPLEAFPPGAVASATVELSQETIQEYATDWTPVIEEGGRRTEGGAFATKEEAIADVLQELRPGEGITVHREMCAIRYGRDCDCVPEVYGDLPERPA